MFSILFFLLKMIERKCNIIRRREGCIVMYVYGEEKVGENCMVGESEERTGRVRRVRRVIGYPHSIPSPLSTTITYIHTLGKSIPTALVEAEPPQSSRV